MKNETPEWKMDSIKEIFENHLDLSIKYSKKELQRDILLALDECKKQARRETEINTIEAIISVFNIYSDLSTQCLGYKYLNNQLTKLKEE